MAIAPRPGPPARPDSETMEKLPVELRNWIQDFQIWGEEVEKDVVEAAVPQVIDPFSNVINDWGPIDASFPSSGFATLDTRNTHPVADFSDSAFNRLFFHGVMPDNYTADSDLTVTIYYSMTSATTGDVNWQAELENMLGLDIDSDSFASAESVDDTVPGIAGEVKKLDLTMDTGGTHLDSLDAGDLFRLEITRGGSNVSDTATGDAELHMVQLRVA